MTNSSYRLNSSLSESNFKLSCESVLSKLIIPDRSLLEFILTHVNTNDAQVILPDGRKYCWYLAIGSMTNPISLYLRELTAIVSYPARCLDHRITFRSHNGMADIEMCPGAEFHGVVHLLTDEQMARLDEIEVFYHRIQLQCIDYQEQIHTVYAYQMNIKNQPTSLPHERYLDIIIKGCEYYQVQAEYLNRLKDEQAVIPRKQPSTFQVFTNIPLDVYYSREDLEKHNGSNPSLPLWISVNGKILEYTGLPSPDHSDYEFQRHFHFYLAAKLGGREITTVLAKTLYEPLYKLPLTDEDICDEHRAQIEDHYYSTLASSQNKIYWKPIGRLRKS